MQPSQDWVFSARGRMVTARVEIDSKGGGTITRFDCRPGPSQTGLSIKVASQQEAAVELERILTALLGSDW